MRLNKLTSQLHSEVNWNTFVCKKKGAFYRCYNADMDTKVYSRFVPSGGQKIGKKKHAHIWTHARGTKAVCRSCNPTQISDTVFPLHGAARIRALVCSSPCLVMLALGFFAGCAHKHTHTHTNSQWLANICGASCWQWSRYGHDCLAVFV